MNKKRHKKNVKKNLKNIFNSYKTIIIISVTINIILLVFAFYTISNNKLYASYKNGKWGFVDVNQKVIVDYKYDFVTEFQNGVAGFKINGLWGVLSDDGKVQLEATYQINSNDVKFLSKYYEVYNGIGVPMYSGDKVENED